MYHFSLVSMRAITAVKGIHSQISLAEKTTVNELGEQKSSQRNNASVLCLGESRFSLERAFSEKSRAKIITVQGKPYYCPARLAAESNKVHSGSIFRQVLVGVDTMIYQMAGGPSCGPSSRSFKIWTGQAS